MDHWNEIERLGKLRNDGLLSEEEFQQWKTRILQSEKSQKIGSSEALSQIKEKLDDRLVRDSNGAEPQRKKRSWVIWALFMVFFGALGGIGIVNYTGIDHVGSLTPDIINTVTQAAQTTLDLVKTNDARACNRDDVKMPIIDGIRGQKLTPQDAMKSWSTDLGGSLNMMAAISLGNADLLIEDSLQDAKRAIKYSIDHVSMTSLDKDTHNIICSANLNIEHDNKSKTNAITYRVSPAADDSNVMIQTLQLAVIDDNRDFILAAAYPIFQTKLNQAIQEKQRQAQVSNIPLQQPQIQQDQQADPATKPDTQYQQNADGKGDDHE